MSALAFAGKMGPWAKEEPMGTVLIVDDDALIARATARVLKGWGWKALTATNLKEARRLVEEADVVLSDWEPMGPMVAAEFRKPIVVFTGSPDLARAKLAEIGATHVPVLTKPVDGETIHDNITRKAGFGS